MNSKKRAAGVTAVLAVGTAAGVVLGFSLTGNAAPAPQQPQAVVSTVTAPPPSPVVKPSPTTATSVRVAPPVAAETPTVVDVTTSEAPLPVETQPVETQPASHPTDNGGPVVDGGGVTRAPDGPGIAPSPGPATVSAQPSSIPTN